MENAKAATTSQVLLPHGITVTDGKKGGRLSNSDPFPKREEFDAFNASSRL
jgi:hypothetical protein